MFSLEGFLRVASAIAEIGQGNVPVITHNDIMTNLEPRDQIVENINRFRGCVNPGTVNNELGCWPGVKPDGSFGTHCIKWTLTGNRCATEFGTAGEDFEATEWWLGRSLW